MAELDHLGCIQARDSAATKLLRISCSPMLGMGEMAGPTVALKRALIKRARELADSGQFTNWAGVEAYMKLHEALGKKESPLEDIDLRHELDSRCSAARRKARPQ